MIWAVLEHWDYDGGWVIGFTDDEDLAEAINKHGQMGGGCYEAVKMEGITPVKELLKELEHSPNIGRSYYGRKAKGL